MTTTLNIQPQLIAMLRKCRDQFSFYATNHRAKYEDKNLSLQTRNDGRVKALANEALVAEIDGVLSIDGIVDVGSSDTIDRADLIDHLRAETISILRAGHDEIVALRRQVESLAPRAHAYDTIAQMLKLTHRDEVKGYSVDVVWRMREAIDDLLLGREQAAAAKNPSGS